MQADAGTAAPRPWRAAAVMTALAAAVLSLLAFGLLGHAGFFSIDSAVKYIQARAFLDSGFRSMALPYPGAPLDPEGVFFPFEPPFVFLSAGRFQSIFPSAFALLASPLVALGPASLTVWAVVGGALAVPATALLGAGGFRWQTGALLLFATPVWFYAIGSGETTLAIAGAAFAFAAAFDGGERGDRLAGLGLGLAAVFRDEALLLLPGLLFARYLRSRVFRPAHLLAWVAGPILAMAAVDGAWLDRPPLAHLRHAAPFLNLVLPRSHAVLPHLPSLSWPERWETVVNYWTVGGSTWIAVAGAAGIALAYALARHRVGPAAVAAVVATAALVQLLLLARLVPAPRFEAGLMRLAPFLVFAFLPAAPGTPRSDVRRIAGVTTAAFVVLTFLTLSTTGGKGLGPRLTAGLWPLLVVAAWEGFASWRLPASRTRMTRLIRVAGWMLIAGSVVMELGVALPAWAARSHDDDGALALVGHLPDPVIVIDDDVEIQLVGPLYFSRDVLLVARAGDWPALGDHLARAGVRAFVVVSRDSPRTAAIGPYRYAEHWEASRYWIGRWVRY